LLVRKEDIESRVQEQEQDQEEDEDEAPPPSPKELQYVRDIKWVSFISCLLTILLLFLFKKMFLAVNYICVF
jgi:hypothetical protein